MSVIRDNDHGYKGLLKRAKLKARLTVGIHAAEGSKPKTPHEGESSQPGLTVADVATWLEFGTPTQEARPFIRGWFDENKALAQAAVTRLAKAVVDGKLSRSDALEKLGLFFVGQIQKKVAQGLQPPNRPSTIARKGSDKAGIDTGQTRSSITHEVK